MAILNFAFCSMTRSLGRSLNSAARFGRIFTAMILALSVVSSAPAQTISAEYKLKAVFLYNFVQFVDWPASAFNNEQSPLIIGVLGTDPFGKFLDATVRGEVVKNRRLEIRRYKNVDEIGNCHVLFISASHAGNLNSILAGLKERSILTVSDTEEFARSGGMVRFITENHKIRFRINVEVVKAAHLTISSKLLQLAEITSAEQRP